MNLYANYEEAANRWGIAKLRRQGVVVPDDAKITYEEATEDDGYCETCSYVYGVVYVSWGSASYIYLGYFSELLSELLAAGEENDNE